MDDYVSCYHETLLKNCFHSGWHIFEECSIVCILGLSRSPPPCGFQHGGLDMRGEDEMTPEVIKRQMTDAEWQKVYDMSRDKNLYHNLCSSLFPAIYGELVTIENEQERY